MTCFDKILLKTKYMDKIFVVKPPVNYAHSLTVLAGCMHAAMRM